MPPDPPKGARPTGTQEGAFATRAASFFRMTCSYKSFWEGCLVLNKLMNLAIIQISFTQYLCWQVTSQVVGLLNLLIQLLLV